MAEKISTGQEVCLPIPSAHGVMQVKEGTDRRSALSGEARARVTVLPPRRQAKSRAASPCSHGNNPRARDCSRLG